MNVRVVNDVTDVNGDGSQDGLSCVQRVIGNLGEISYKSSSDVHSGRRLVFKVQIETQWDATLMPASTCDLRSDPCQQAYHPSNNSHFTCGRCQNKVGEQSYRSISKSGYPRIKAAHVVDVSRHLISHHHIIRRILAVPSLWVALAQSIISIVSRLQP